MAANEAAASATAPAGSSGGTGPLILALMNTVAILGAMGMLFYVKMVYKRPAITEEGERKRIAELRAKPMPVPTPALIVFDPVTVNIATTPTLPKAADGTPVQIHGKLHYVKVGFAIEIRDKERSGEIELIRPVIMDKLLSMLSRKPFHELTTVQGRYVLRTQIIDTVNELLRESSQAKKSEDGLITSVYFTDFLAQ
jgi:flagellar basal body-associated protein FliL